MYTIRATNVNQAIALGAAYLLRDGVEETSRNGTVLVAPGPVVTVYSNPRERVLFSPTRDANPFFHLMEALWMMAGRNDVAWPVLFNKNFGQFSDNGATFHGAYGYRWRKWFAYDQLTLLAKELKNNPNTRRAVLTMWDASNNDQEYGVLDDFYLCSDLEVAISGGKDVPCNTHVYFDVRGGKLNMTVCCRSNDIIWGCYGANVVHFSVLQEVMAAWVGVPVGEYRQFSNNFHVYTDVFSREKLQKIVDDAIVNNLYADGKYNVAPYPIVNTTSIETWFRDLETFFEDPEMNRKTAMFPDSFFRHVASPMYRAWMFRKERNWQVSANVLATVQATDWRVAAQQWVERRYNGEPSAASVRPQGTVPDATGHSSVEGVE